MADLNKTGRYKGILTTLHVGALPAKVGPRRPKNQISGGAVKIRWEVVNTARRT